jgi:mRNA interferase MazF
VKAREIWLIDLGNPVGSEAAFIRPVIVVGNPRMSGPLALVCPLTTTPRDYPWRVEIEPDSTNGLSATSHAQVEHVRSVSTARAVARLGRIDAVSFERVRAVLRVLFDL